MPKNKDKEIDDLLDKIIKSSSEGKAKLDQLESLVKERKDSIKQTIKQLEIPED